jgi:hypothetical protein
MPTASSTRLRPAQRVIRSYCSYFLVALVLAGGVGVVLRRMYWLGSRM